MVKWIDHSKTTQQFIKQNNFIDKSSVWSAVGWIGCESAYLRI